MDDHQNARLTVHNREQMCRKVKVVVEGQTLKLAAASFNVSQKTAANWVSRYREAGAAGLSDRSSRPRRLRASTSAELVSRVEALRRERGTGHRIAGQTGLSRATVSRILGRLKLNRMSDLEPPPVVQRYEHAAPGDLLHLDIKLLVRIARPSHRVTGKHRDKVLGIGAEYVHVAIDDHSRIAFSAIYPDETRASVLLFLDAALAYYARFGIRFRAVLADNGVSYRSFAFADRCRERLDSNTAAPGPTPRAPTARLNASSRPPCANGLTPAPTRTQPNENTTSLPGSTNTTGADLIPSCAVALHPIDHRDRSGRFLLS